MPTLTPGRIRHGVVFTLKHAEGSPEEADFLRANAELAAIPGVEAFELMREVSPKNPYRFALTMEFADDGCGSGNGAPGLGVGLDNLAQRLRRFAGPDARVDAGPGHDGGYCVRLKWRMTRGLAA